MTKDHAAAPTEGAPTPPRLPRSTGRYPKAPTPFSVAIEATTKKAFLRALATTHGNVTAAGTLLGISRPTATRWAKRWGLLALTQGLGWAKVIRHAWEAREDGWRACETCGVEQIRSAAGRGRPWEPEVPVECHGAPTKD